MNVLISGAGIAGPTLAYWLVRHGVAVTIVESSAALRTGGYVVDFWGAGYDVAERMGLRPALTERGYKVSEVRFVDERGERVGGFPFDALSGSLGDRFISLPRGDLAAAIFGRVASDVETLFGDEIADLRDDGRRVRVTFRRARPREFDLVFGADGLHSRVRELSFGSEGGFESFLGYRVAAFNVSGYRPRDELVYVSFTKPGRQAARFAMRDDVTLFLLVVADQSSEEPETLAGRKAYLHARFDRLGWECADIMRAMERSDALYFDRVSQIHLPAWSAGRIALVGDAAFCPSLLAGEGSSLAMTAAHVLAGELAAGGGDHARAFARYEVTLRPLMERKQKSARSFAGAFAPRTALGVAIRNWVTRAMRLPFIADLALGGTLRDDFVLPDYGVAPASPATHSM